MSATPPHGSTGDNVQSPPLEAPLEELASPLWLLDVKGAVIGGNRAARALEYDAGEAFPLRTPGARHLLDEETALWHALAEGRSLEACVRLPGRAQRVRLLLEPRLSIDGSPIGGLLMLLDTEPPGYGRSLLVRLVDSASRELREPLTPLLSFSHLARRAADAGDRSRVSHYLGRLERRARRLAYLVGELCDLADLLSGSLILKPESFDFATVLREHVDAAASSSRAHVFELTAPASAPIVGDRNRLQRVLAALLSNAVRFSPNGGRVRVRLAASRDLLTLRVLDPGPGIDIERLPDVFDGPCWDPQAPSGGLGLGLYLSREVVELHHGQIHVERTPSGESWLVLNLPGDPDTADSR